MWKYQCTSPPELYHHGILGQKWGVRRYQNKDGSLTKTGKTRQKENLNSVSDQELRNKVDRLRLEKRYNDISGKTNKSGRTTAEKVVNMGRSASNAARDISKMGGKNSPELNAAGKGLDVVSKTVNAGQAIQKISSKKKTVDLSKMSDNELKSVVNRMDLEDQYRDLSAEKVSRGKVTANDILEVAGSVLAVASSAAALALSISQLKKTV